MFNKKEFENGIFFFVFWYIDYCDIVFVYFGGFFYEFIEGDVIIIFS